MKYNVLTRQKIFLETCLTKNVCPNEISSVARFIERNDRIENKRNVKHEKSILRQMCHQVKGSQDPEENLGGDQQGSHQGCEHVCSRT